MTCIIAGALAVLALTPCVATSSVATSGVATSSVATRRGASPVRTASVADSAFVHDVAALPLDSTSTVATELEDIVVTARRSRSRRLELSSESVDVVSVVDAAKTEFDLGEILTRRSAVHVQRSGNLGGGTELSLAGLGGEQVRLAIDGVPFEWSPFGFGLANMPPSLVRRVEVFNGVVPIRFGTDALAGALNVVTDREVPRTGAAVSLMAGSFDTFRGSATVEWSSDDDWYARAAAFVDRSENDYVVTADVWDAQGRLSPRPVHRNNDGFLGYGSMVDVGVVDRPWADRLVLRGYYSAFHKELPHNVVMTRPYGEVTFDKVGYGGALRYAKAFEEISANVVAGYHHRAGELLDVATCLYDWFGNCASETTPGEIGDRARQLETRYDTFYLRGQSTWAFAQDHSLELSTALARDERTGRDVYLEGADMVDPLAVPLGVTSLFAGGAYQVDFFGGALENVFFVKGYAQWAGLGEASASAGNTSRGQSLLRGGFGDTVRLRLARHSRVKAGYERTARIPRPEEYFGDGVLIVENTELLPETSHNLNVALEFEGLMTPAGIFSVSVLGLVREADDLIAFFPDDQSYRYENIADVRAFGAQLDASWLAPFPWFQLFANLGWTNLRNRSSEGRFASFEGDRLPNRPYLRATGRARTTLSAVFDDDDTLILEWTSRWVHAFFRSWESVGVSKQEVPTQLVHSAALSYRVSTETRAVSLSLSVQNLTDADVFDVVGVQRPGRSFFATVVGEL
ncbi:MAG: TonB-dependent receptor plug domain-containing protein [Deltaproteobacteria bacterium]